MRTRPVSNEARAKMRQARLRYNLPAKFTKLEQTLCHEFKKRRLKFETQKCMFGRFQPDFIFERARLIVQADGDYWQRQNRANAERDQRFNDVAAKANWTVWRFAESEIISNPASCGRAVARFVRDHKR